LHRSLHQDRVRVEVDVAPPKCKQLAFPDLRQEGQTEERLGRLAFNRGEERAAWATVNTVFFFGS
jgi:hypothetical protein